MGNICPKKSKNENKNNKVSDNNSKNLTVSKDKNDMQSNQNENKNNENLVKTNVVKDKNIGVEVEQYKSEPNKNKFDDINNLNKHDSTIIVKEEEKPNNEQQNQISVPELDENQSIITNDEDKNKPLSLHNNQVLDTSKKPEESDQQRGVIDTNIIDTSKKPEESNQQSGVTDDTQVISTANIIPEESYLVPTNTYLFTTQKDQCPSIKESTKIKNTINEDIVKYEQESKQFRGLLSKLDLDNVVEKVIAKSTAVRCDKFEGWKNVFIKSLGNISLVNASGIAEVINKDLEKLINQDENTCIFQGRDFNEESEEKSSVFSIYFAIVKKEQRYEINYCYKVLAWEVKKDSKAKEILNETEFKKSRSSAMRLDALKEFQNEVL